MLRPSLTSTTSKDLKRPSIYARPTHGRCRQPLRCLSNRHCRTISITGKTGHYWHGTTSTGFSLNEIPPLPRHISKTTSNNYRTITYAKSNTPRYFPTRNSITENPRSCRCSTSLTIPKNTVPIIPMPKISTTKVTCSIPKNAGEVLCEKWTSPISTIPISNICNFGSWILSSITKTAAIRAVCSTSTSEKYRKIFSKTA